MLKFKNILKKAEVTKVFYNIKMFYQTKIDFDKYLSNECSNNINNGESITKNSINEKNRFYDTIMSNISKIIYILEV